MLFCLRNPRFVNCGTVNQERLPGFHVSLEGDGRLNRSIGASKGRATGESKVRVDEKSLPNGVATSKMPSPWILTVQECILETAIS